MTIVNNVTVKNMGRMIHAGNSGIIPSSSVFISQKSSIPAPEEDVVPAIMYPSSDFSTNK